MTEKIAGIFGGMGPQATVDLMQRIIELTPASDDCDHIRCIVDNHPKVPSRIKAIIEKTGEDPAPVMADMGKRLETFGADFLAIACNTAHYYYDAVKNAVEIPVIHVIDEVTDHIRTRYPDEKQIGILASPAVAMTRLYTRSFERYGLVDVWPDPGHQEVLLEVIKAVKRGKTDSEVRAAYRKVAASFDNQEVRVAVVACTELSALDEELPLTRVDAATVLAEKIISMAREQ